MNSLKSENPNLKHGFRHATAKEGTMNKYYSRYAYVVEINYTLTGYTQRYEFVSEEEAIEFIDSLNNKLPNSAKVKFI